MKKSRHPFEVQVQEQARIIQRQAKTIDELRVEARSLTKYAEQKDARARELLDKISALEKGAPPSRLNERIARLEGEVSAVTKERDGLLGGKMVELVEFAKAKGERDELRKVASLHVEIIKELRAVVRVLCARLEEEAR